MNKISINTMDKQVKYDFNICTLMTKTYKVKLKTNEIHSPSAAKLIVEFDGIIKAFLLEQPIISVGKNGDVEVLTTMLWDEAIYLKANEYSKDDIKELIHTKKLMKAKKNIGLSFDEIHTEKSVLSKLNIISLKKNKFNPNKGGGF